MTKVLVLAAVVAVLGIAILVASRRPPRIERSKGVFKAFTAPEDVEGPFVAWLKERGFGPVEGGWRGPSGTRAPMTVLLVREGGRIQVSAAWTFEGPESEEEGDEARALAFVQTLIEWGSSRKAP